MLFWRFVILAGGLWTFYYTALHHDAATFALYIGFIQFKTEAEKVWVWKTIKLGRKTIWSGWGRKVPPAQAPLPKLSLGGKVWTRAVNYHTEIEVTAPKTTGGIPMLCRRHCPDKRPSRLLLPFISRLNGKRSNHFGRSNEKVSTAVLVFLFEKFCFVLR